MRPMLVAGLVLAALVALLTLPLAMVIAVENGHGAMLLAAILFAPWGYGMVQVYRHSRVVM